MPNTPGGLPYPALADVPNVPTDMEELAEAVDLVAIPDFVDEAARDAAFPTPSEGQHAYITSLNCTTWYTGASWQGNWKSYTPTWTAVGTAPAIGNGTLTGRYLHKPGLVIAEVRLVLGTTTTGGTGAWFFTLPVTASAATVGGGSGWALDSGVQEYGGIVPKLETTSAFRLIWHTGPVRSDAPVTPFAWGANDELRVQVQYSPAA